MSGACFAASIDSNLDAFNGSQNAALDTAFSERQEVLDLVLIVHDLIDDRQVLRQTLDLEGVNHPGVRAEPHDSAQLGSTLPCRSP
jgi:hypothetical protein